MLDTVYWLLHRAHAPGRIKTKLAVAVHGLRYASTCMPNTPSRAADMSRSRLGAGHRPPINDWLRLLDCNSGTVSR